jgi:hypothetical protein
MTSRVPPFFEWTLRVQPERRAKIKSCELSRSGPPEV